MNYHFLDILLINVAIFTIFLAIIGVAMRRIRWSGELAYLASIQPVTCHTSFAGKCYAKLPFITIAPSGDPCPLLRTILRVDLACREITEITGGGDTWW